MPGDALALVALAMTCHWLSARVRRCPPLRSAVVTQLVTRSADLNLGDLLRTRSFHMWGSTATFLVRAGLHADGDPTLVYALFPALCPIVPSCCAMCSITGRLVTCSNRPRILGSTRPASAAASKMARARTA